MGNCLETSRKSTAEIAPADVMKNQPTVKLYGAPFGIETYYIRFALLYKPVSLKFLPSDRHDTPVIEYKSDSVSGSPEVMVQFLDAKFPEPQLLKGSVGGWYGETTPLLVWVVTLQHRSILWHLDPMVRWAEENQSLSSKKSSSSSSAWSQLIVNVLHRLEEDDYSVNAEQLIQVGDSREEDDY